MKHYFNEGKQILGKKKTRKSKPKKKNIELLKKFIEKIK